MLSRIFNQIEWDIELKYIVFYIYFCSAAGALMSLFLIPEKSAFLSSFYSWAGAVFWSCIYLFLKIIRLIFNN